MRGWRHAKRDSLVPTIMLSVNKDVSGIAGAFDTHEGLMLEINVINLIFVKN